MFDKKVLIERCGHYFKDNDRQIIYATTDGNFFNENHYAASHAHSLKTEMITIVREDLSTSSPSDEPSVKELKAVCAEKGYPETEWKKLNKEPLKKYMADKESEETPEKEASDEGEESEEEETKDLEALYKSETDNNAIWRGKETKPFKEWKASR